jgi:hypothetical protein
MITMSGFGPDFGLPEHTSFVTKTFGPAPAGRLPYCIALTMPNNWPRGQLPFNDDDGERVAGWAFIHAHIERKCRIVLDEGLTAQ